MGKMPDAEAAPNPDDAQRLMDRVLEGREMPFTDEELLAFDGALTELEMLPEALTAKAVDRAVRLEEEIASARDARHPQVAESAPGFRRPLADNKGTRRSSRGQRRDAGSSKQPFIDSLS